MHEPEIMAMRAITSHHRFLRVHPRLGTKLNACRPIRHLLWCAPLLVAILASGVAAPATAGFPDEIQVYVDDVKAQGERGLELHVNTTPKGVSEPGSPGTVRNNHGLRITPEFSYGIGADADLGLYLPTVRDGAGNWYLPGLKLRAKWIPIRGDEKTGGWYLGVNGEISNISKKFADSRVSTEIRTIAGYRSETWLIGVNPILSWSLSPGQRESNPELEMAWKVSRNVAQGIALGFEYYSGMGKLRNYLPKDQQDRTLFLTADVNRAPWIFNFGIGRGQTNATDPWTVKAIFSFEFD
jgi:hypothetical protein